MTVGEPKMDVEDAHAMYELQLELHALSMGARPPITADEVLDLRDLLENPSGDLLSLLAMERGRRRRPQSG